MTNRLDIIKWVDTLIDNYYSLQERHSERNADTSYKLRVAKENSKLKIRAMLGELE